MAGFLDSVRQLFARENEPAGQQIVWSDDTVNLVEGMTPDELWRTQPYLRTVVSFIARNIAHLGLHTYVRVSDTDRQRSTDSPIAKLLKRPNPTTTTYELINATVSDLKLRDVAYWHLTKSADSPSGWELWNIPASWVTGRRGGSVWQPDGYIVQRPGGRPAEVKADQMIVFHGWDPAHPSRGSSPVEALRGLLIEQISAQTYRTQVWQRGGRVGTYITRPVNAPGWSPDERERFRRGWNSRFSGNRGPQAGETPILGDGMEIKHLRFSAKEDEWAEVAKLSLAMVASVYHVNPTMVGLLDNANYSNTREFRKMLYGDTLGPDIAMLEDRINTFLVPKITNEPDVYVEFNIDEKLQGSFEEQAKQLQAAVGAPWMTRNEARGIRNMPQIEGGDDLVVPLNLGRPEGEETSRALSADEVAKLVTAATALIRSGFAPAAALQAVGLNEVEHLGLLPVTLQRPVDEAGEVDQEIADELEGEKSRNPLTKEAVTGPPEEFDQSSTVDAVEEVVTNFFQRQLRVVLTALGAKAEGDWWDSARWNRELTDDLYDLALEVTEQVGKGTAVGLGYQASAYDPEKTVAFLRSVARRRAEMINQATLERIEELLGEDFTPAEAAETALTEAQKDRATVAAVTIVTALVAFSMEEAAKQIAPEEATKTWIVTSGNPRSTHAAMNGETVPVGSKFSNGMMWPGDYAGGPDEVAGCQCELEIDIPAER